MTFKAAPYADRWQGLLAILGLLLLDGLLVRVAFVRPVDGFSFIMGLIVLGSLPVLGYLIQRTVSVFMLEYWVDRDGVVVVWGPSRQVVPMGDIRCIKHGIAGDPVSPPRLWDWPCPECRPERSAALGYVRAYATRPLAEQIVLETNSGNYGLSPADPDAFLAALQTRYRLGVARARRAEVQRPPLWTWSLWRDWRALALIGAGLLAVLLMFGVLSFRLPALSSDLPLHFDVDGLPDRIAPKINLFALPFIGFVTWLVNLTAGVWVYRQLQRQGAYLLWAGAFAVQLIFALALFNLMRW